MLEGRRMFKIVSSPAGFLIFAIIFFRHCGGGEAYFTPHPNSLVFYSGSIKFGMWSLPGIIF